MNDEERKLSDFLVPIGSLTRQAVAGRHVLSPERAAELDRGLAELRAARRQAALDSRDFLVGSS